MKRHKTRQIKVGGVKIGGGAPVSIQSMTKVETSDVRAAVAQINRLETVGCEIIRVAVKSFDDARAIRDIKRKIKIPLVADIHFNYRLAIESINSGADKIRLNPGNIGKRNDIEAVIRAAKKEKIPIRIGVNSGSVVSPPRQAQETGRGSHKAGNLSSELADAVSSYIKLLEEEDFYDIIISLKASDVATTIEAYRSMSGVCSYPLHLGVTASGSYDSGVIKSAIGIGSLLADGIGDTIRVSLTADPVEEVIAAKRILSAVGTRHFGPEVISCPTCGRCQVDLGEIVRRLEKELSTARYSLIANRGVTIAVMGCEVNGPGEAKEADIGIAFGKNSGMLFKKGKKIKKVETKNAIKELLKII
ncbi:MAG: flavodoxin-dependent (E)-4-hydroxy-3-methylbut-2-enyl-diphosphate synthase [Candidatus Omnitrophica bacterium]|nr:flavodoxin-dependent (E)-4-hydroxy-3-methylbut-2-enyl-diphosphate synthase [Candidatus Omnitrophota bacterium]